MAAPWGPVVPFLGPMCVGVSEEALGEFLGALWPLGGASGRSFVALQAPGNQKEASGEPTWT